MNKKVKMNKNFRELGELLILTKYKDDKDNILDQREFDEKNIRVYRNCIPCGLN